MHFMESISTHERPQRDTPEGCPHKTRIAAKQARTHEQVADLLRVTCGKKPWLRYDTGHAVGGMYMQQRMGQHENPIMVVKIETMALDAHDSFEHVLQTQGVNELGDIQEDPRAKGLGKFLRLYKINELPQLLQWICGHLTGNKVLSFLGTRPQLEKDWELQMQDHDGELRKRVLQSLPGLFKIDYALPVGASAEERKALWSQYADSCIERGQTRTNLALAPKVIWGMLKRWWPTQQQERE